jgi:hypothetical protein
VYLTTHHRLADPGAGAPIWRSAADPRLVSLHQIADLYRTVEEGEW